MLTKHQHKPGEFDPGHCQDCAHETSLLDHYWHVHARSGPSRTSTGGPATPTGRPSGPCGPLAPGSCSPSSAY
jgi:hypothetical protein